MDFPVLLAFLLFGWAEAATAPDPPVKSVQLGGAVTLPVIVPKGQSFSNLLLRETLRKEAVAVWMDSKDISVLNTKYANRVTFQNDQMEFRIANLSLDDGGCYEISTGPSDPTKVLSNFLVAVFNITTKTSTLGNDSCYIDLNCEAGMGPSHRVNYTWKDTEDGTTLSQKARITQLVHTNQEKAYTCVAQSPTAQSSFVLQHLCVPNTASPGPWVLGSLLVRGLLMTATLLLLL